jgi:hypothetical protein
MNIMEFKIAVIGSQLYGDLSLISNNTESKPQADKGFKDV